MIITHQPNCPMEQEIGGQWDSTPSAYCNCYSEINKEEVYKILAEEQAKIIKCNELRKVLDNKWNMIYPSYWRMMKEYKKIVKSFRFA